MGYSASIQRTLPIRRGKVFAALADFGGIGRLVPSVVKSVIDLTGEGVGSVRTIELNPECGFEGIVMERVEASLEGRLFSYSIIGDSPLPMRDYTAVVQLEDAGEGCKVIYSSNWEAVGVDETEHRTTMEGLYQLIVDGIVDVN